MFRIKLDTSSSILRLLIIVFFGQLDRAVALCGQGVQRVEPDELPFLVSLAMDNDEFDPAETHFCTGTLITDQMVLTAKHCAYALDRFPVVMRIGCPDLRNCRKYYWETWTSYHMWAIENNRTVDPKSDDVSVVKLKDKVDVQPAVLRSAPNAVKSGSRLYIAGWGDLDDGSKPHYLRKAAVKVLTTQECESRTASFESMGFFNWERMICTMSNHGSGYAILGHGDSGGPIYDGNYRIVGINSGVSEEPDKPRDEVVNSHCTVAFFRDFIESFLSVE